MTEPSAVEALQEFRTRIDAVDRSILLLLNERARIVEEIGRVKQKAHMPIYEPRREDQVFDNVTRHNTGPLAPEAVRRIYERIIDEMRGVQREQMEAASQSRNREGAAKDGDSPC